MTLLFSSLMCVARGVRAGVGLCVIGALLLLPAEAAAQAAVGALVGNVKDESGSAVPGATITATEVRTNIIRTAVSNETGNYSFTNLAPGVYRVGGELVGFRKFAREDVDVNVNTTIRVDITLSVGALEESVLVTGEAPMLQTDRTDTGRIIESTQIRSCPSRSTGTSRARWRLCPARRARSGRTRSSTIRRTVCRATSTGRNGSRMPCSSKARTTAITVEIWRS